MLNKEINNKNKLIFSFIVIIILIVCFCIVTYAYVSNNVSVNDNKFVTGNVEININDGEPVIDKDEFKLEPGMTIKKSFFIKNESTINVYYKLYLDNIEGDLKDIVVITIKEDNTTLYSDIASNLTKDNVIDSYELNKDETKNLTIYFYYPSNSNNKGQNKDLSFNLSVDATQQKNNPNKLFSNGD